MAASEMTSTNGGLFTVVDETKTNDSRETHRKDDGGSPRRPYFDLGEKDEVQKPGGEENGPKQRETLRVNSVESEQFGPSVVQSDKTKDRKLSEPVMGSMKIDVGSARKLSFPDVIARRSAFSEKRKKLAKGKLGRGEKQRKRQRKGLGPRGKSSDPSVYCELREQDSLEGKGAAKKSEYRDRRKSCIPQINIENCQSSNEGDVFKTVNIDTTGPLPSIPNSTEFCLMKPGKESRSGSPRPRLRISSSYSDSTNSRSSRAASRSSRASDFESFGTPPGSLDQDLYFSATSLNNTSPELRNCPSKSPVAMLGKPRFEQKSGAELCATPNRRRASSPALPRKQSDASRSPHLTPVLLKGCCSERQLSGCTHELDRKTSLPNLSANNSSVKLNKMPSPTPSGSQSSKRMIMASQTIPAKFSVATKEEYLDASENECQSKFGRILSIICMLFFISYLIIIYNHFASMARAHERFKYYTLEEEQRFQEFIVQIDIS